MLGFGPGTSVSSCTPSRVLRGSHGATTCVCLDVHDWMKGHDTGSNRIGLTRSVPTCIQTQPMCRTRTKHLRFIAEWDNEMEHAKEYSYIMMGCFEELRHHVCMMDMSQDVWNTTYKSCREFIVQSFPISLIFPASTIGEWWLKHLAIQPLG